MANAEALENDPNEKKWIDNIRSESERMNELITDLLDLAKLENGANIENYHIENLSKIVEKTLLTFESLIYENNIELVYNISENININCNSNQMKQLTAILLDNAIQHSEKDGKITVTLEKEKNDIVLKVSNKGKEMPKEMPNMNVENSNSSIRTIHYIMFVMEGIIISILITYLVMSKFNKFTLQETLNGTSKVIIFGLIIIIITTALTLAQICIAKKFFTAENSNSQNNQQMFPGENMNSSSNSVTRVGANEIDGTDETLTSSYTASESDESVILVENGGNVTLNADKQTLEGNIEIDNINRRFLYYFIRR